MDHAITAGDLILVGGIGLGIVILLVIIFGLISLFNPFRSGH